MGSLDLVWPRSRVSTASFGEPKLLCSKAVFAFGHLSHISFLLDIDFDAESKDWDLFLVPGKRTMLHRHSRRRSHLVFDQQPPERQWSNGYPQKDIHRDDFQFTICVCSDSCLSNLFETVHPDIGFNASSEWVWRKLRPRGSANVYDLSARDVLVGISQCLLVYDVLLLLHIVGSEHCVGGFLSHSSYAVACVVHFLFPVHCSHDPCWIC